MEARNSAVEDVVRGWYERVSATQYAHYSSASYYSSRNLWLGIPAIILSTVVGTTVFASLKTQPDSWVQIAAGLASVAAAVLAGLQTFFGYSALAEKHRVAAAKYGVIGRKLEYLLARSGIDPSIIDGIQQSLESLAIESPNNPKFIYRNAIQQIEAATPGKHPTV